MKRIYFLINILLIIFSMSLVSCKPNATDAVMERLIGKKDHRFEFKLIISDVDYFEIKAENNKVVIEGNSNNSLCYGVYRYLKEIGAAHISWEGQRIALPEQLPEFHSEKVSSPFKHRMYMNVCAFGYSTVWWDWNRWEKEIDWMALHGINMPTAMMGQEYVWQRVWKKLGLTDEDLNNYFTGPAFLPWHRMGNINAHGGPLPQEWIDREMNMQKKVLQRMRELDMNPVVPSFSGYVPPAFKEKFVEANVRQMGSWSKGFEGTYMLDPKDPMFKEVGRLFLETYQEVYGKCEFFLADSFNEMRPPVSKGNKNEELSQYGKAVYESISEVIPEATWVMQGWLFGHDHKFWTPDAVKAFLKDVPEEKLLIQDFGNDRYEVWKDLKAFHGKQWIYGYVHNYGGTNPVFGDLKFYQSSVKELLGNPEKGELKGFGVMPEGIYNNSVIYEYLYDIAWDASQQEIPNWQEDYLKNRYGKVTKEIKVSWDILTESVYAVKYWKPRWTFGAGSYIHNKRPSLDILKWKEFPGDPDKLKKALNKYLDSSKEYSENYFYYYDMAEFARHYFAMQADKLLIEACKHYKAENLLKADISFKKFEDLMLKLNALAGFHPNNTLSKWCNDAVRCSGNKELYLKNAKQQITIWGGESLKDYASKEWAGIIDDFYLPRWQMFFAALKNSNGNFEENKVRQEITEWEIAWVNSLALPENPEKLSYEDVEILIVDMINLICN